MVDDLPLGGGSRRLVPAEMPAGQLVGLEHAGAPADGDEALEESDLQRALGRLAARPQVVLLDQLVVVDIADRQRPVPADAREHLALVLLGDCREPRAPPRPVAPHGAEVEAQVADGEVGQRVRPVLEHRLVDGLGLVQVLAAILGNAREEDVMVAALDDVDGVDLHVAQVLDRGPRRLSPAAERRRLVEPLRVQPDASGTRDY